MKGIVFPMICTDRKVNLCPVYRRLQICQYKQPCSREIKLVIDSPDVVRVKIGDRVVDTAKGGKKEATVTLPDRPVPLVIDFTGQNTGQHTVKLSWSGPGLAEEVIPADALFHDRKAETAIK